MWIHLKQQLQQKQDQHQHKSMQQKLFIAVDVRNKSGFSSMTAALDGPAPTNPGLTHPQPTNYRLHVHSLYHSMST